MEGLYIIIDLFIVIQTVTSGVMCVYGYKWSKGLIAIMSSYVGLGVGLLLSIPFIDSAGLGSLILVPICISAISGLAYTNIKFNHFMAGFLLAVKVSFMIITKMYESGMFGDIGWLFVVPIIIGIYVGGLSCTVFSGYIVLACLAFLGAIEFVPKIFEWINGTLFAVTGDWSFIFDPVSYILSLFGIEIPSSGEVICILLLSVGGFYFQKLRAEKEGINFSDKIFDDRKLKD